MRFTMLIAASMLTLLQTATMAQGPTDPDKEVRKYLYRWADSRGQINYGDRPPPDAQNLLRIDLRQIGEQVASLLPYQVRRASSSYPVMLFTAGKCPPCNTAREFLIKRGIPFAERTIETGDDSVELKRLTQAEGVPVATVGSASLIGFDPDEWNITLDASGYPKTSQLTVNFKQESARPLTQKEKAPAAVAKQ
ncbi:MAG TPA: glutaredoxin family protein [Burkholderiaceae bacterium]|nr:glutaredoxin family protein [Burkholderiaceae bacterium]